MKKSRLPAIWLLLLGLLAFSPMTFARGLILTAPPRESPAAGMKQYGPLAAYLTRLFGRTVKYVHPTSWLAYQTDMRHDKYDIIFDGPHFISWRIAHLHNQAVVRLPGYLQFFLLTGKDNDKLNSVNDLVAKTFCGVPPPNLATLSILAAFPNPVEQPVIRGIRGAAAAVIKAFKAGKCDAMVLRRAFYLKRVPAAEKAQWKIIYTSKPYPNQGITVSTRVTQRERDLMVQALTVGDGVKATEPILKRFGGRAKHFIPAKNSEFAGINNLLEGVIFGW